MEGHIVTLVKNIHSYCRKVTQVDVILFTPISIISPNGGYVGVGLVETYAIFILYRTIVIHHHASMHSTYPSSPSF